MSTSKRSYPSTSDLNNNNVLGSSSSSNKKRKSIVTSGNQQSHTIGQIKELRMVNFMCHKNFSIQFHSTPMQIVTGANGSGKSAIANAICLCLGAQARTTGRTSNAQSFIRNGEIAAELTLILANEGPEAYKSELYGKEIHIIRRIGAKKSGYKVLSDHHKLISTQKETISEILQSLSISPENPLCILHQEIAKTFLLNSNSQKKYQFYMKVSQLDQIKQAYEEGVCTVESLIRRINGMKQKYNEMYRIVEMLNSETKKIENRRDQEKKKHELEKELNSARNAEQKQIIIELKNELDQTEKSKNIIDDKMTEISNQIDRCEQNIKQFKEDQNDIEKDLSGIDGLFEIKLYLAKQKKETELIIYRLSRDCEKYYQELKESEDEQNRLRKQMNESQNFNQQSTNDQEQRIKLEKEIHNRQAQQIEWDKSISSFTDDINISNENIHKKESTKISIENELKQKQHELNELEKIEKDKTNVYGSWMNDCLQAIENENRFHLKPIGPIGRYIHCINPYWSYAVEKHLASIMSEFICSNNHDEKILLEIFSRYSHGYRPAITVKQYSRQVHDISGTLGYIRRANLLSIYDVLKIDNVTVECQLIDSKHIEATILVENLQHAKQIKQNGILNWPKVNKKVKQVAEAWTYDGSNIKLDKAFRIYTNDKQPARYFLSNNNQSLSTNELKSNIKHLNEQIQQINISINELKNIHQITSKNFEELKQRKTINEMKICELNQELERMNSTMPMTCSYSLDELKQIFNECIRTYNIINQQFHEARDKKELQHQKLAEIIQKYENIIKKIDLKTHEHDIIKEKINEELIEQQQLQQQELPKLTKKYAQLNDDIRKCQERLTDLTKIQLKKSKITTNRSVREIQQELDAINHFLQSNEDTLEKRRQIIEEYKTKRDHAQHYKKISDQCSRQVQRLEKFVHKRRQRFGEIADRHLYLLRHNFTNLMEKYQFEDCDIQIDHRKEELEIIIRKNRRSIASLSGGERSISTFCFLLALWGSIYQPFRLLDEIDIYMDNEKRNSCLELLHENTRYYSSSQHIILTPQAIDNNIWQKLHVPVFYMPTPKRSL